MRRDGRREGGHRPWQQTTQRPANLFLGNQHLAASSPADVGLVRTNGGHKSPPFQNDPPAQSTHLDSKCWFHLSLFFVLTTLIQSLTLLLSLNNGSTHMCYVYCTRSTRAVGANLGWPSHRVRVVVPLPLHFTNSRSGLVE